LSPTHHAAAAAAGVKKIVVFDRMSAAGLWPGEARVVGVQGDLTKQEDLTAALTAHRAGAVLHVASPHPNGNDKTLFHRVNVLGTAAVIAACRSAGVHTLVYTSSASVVWQGAAQEGVDESVPYPAVFRDAYAETKARAEELVLAAGKGHAGTGLAAIALRPHAIWGPRDPQMVGTTVAVAAAGRMRAIVGDGSNVVDWTYVGNVVHGHLLALQAGTAAAAARKPCAASGRAYFLTNGAPMPFWRFMNWMVLAFGYDTSTRRLPLAPLVALATAVGWVVALLNAALCRVGEKRIQLTFSAPRLLVAGTAHWYRIDAAARDLGYAPLWSLHQGLYLTVRAFPQLRNPAPSEAVLAKARRGNLVALGLVEDKRREGSSGSQKAASTAAPGGGGRGVIGANQKFADMDSLPYFTPEQVAAHARPDDCWVVIRDLVYDLTAYVDVHPGGDEIFKHAGGDATKGFFGPQHPDHVNDTVKKFLIGKLKK
jgi:sterol-4alpha-carboxylate 3-dehydrogenase (decarboxylating)